MKKFTISRRTIRLVSCLLTISSFGGWRGPSAEAVVSLPQQPPSSCGGGEPRIDLRPGAITNPAGVEIGTITDFVLDLGAGRIIYAVGAFDRGKEFSNKVFVIPWEAVELDFETNTFALSGGKTVSEDAPSFALDTWPALPPSRWGATVAAYWGKQLGHNFAAVNAPESALAKASELIGMTIKNVAGDEVGTIEELVMDPEIGSIAYAVLAFEEAGRSNSTVFFALPWSTVQVDPVQHTFAVDVDKKLLAKSPEVSRESLDHDASPETIEHSRIQINKIRR
jgi:sporulation protein YlmC with PRC-barrel domain